MHFPADAMKQPGEVYARSRRATFEHDRHGELEAIGDDNEEALRAESAGAAIGAGAAARALARDHMMSRAANESTPMVDGRGRHGNRGAKNPYAQTAFEHKESIESGTMGRLCSGNCPYDQKCGLHVTPANLMRAHCRIYGDDTRMIEASSSGPATYHCTRPFKDVQRARRELLLGCITFDAAEPTRAIERFLVDAIGPVCPEYCRRAHGIPIGTWNPLLAAARSGRLRADAEWDEAAIELPEGSLHDVTESSAAKEETIEWWVLWLTLEDQCPNEAAIVHRVVVWDAVPRRGTTTRTRGAADAHHRLRRQRRHRRRSPRSARAPCSTAQAESARGMCGEWIYDHTKHLSKCVN